MISYDSVKQQPNLVSQKCVFSSSTRVHVLGVIEEKKCILYSVATSKTTEIQLFNQYGISTTVIAFNKYMDIISADISFDVEMLIYTERIIINSSDCHKLSKNSDHLFKYETVLCNINSFSKVQVFTDYNPIASYFIPHIEDNEFTSNFNFYKTDNQTYNDINNRKDDILKTYQFIHVIGDKVSHFRANIKKQKIYVRVINNGINISKCQKWFFSKRNLAFYSFNEGKFNVYNIFRDKKKGSTVVVESYPYANDKSSILPKELALKPSTLTNLPYFRFSSGISYVVKINHNGKIDYGVIEQLYKGEDSFLTFTVATVYGKFKNVVTVRGIQPDLPISFLSPVDNRNSVFIFVPNCFISFVDFSFSNPHISMMPHVFSETTFSSQLVSTIDFETNILADLSTGKVFEISLNISSFPPSLHYTDRTILSIIARLVATFPSQVSISSAIENLPSDTCYVLFFFKCVFSILNQLIPTKTSQSGERNDFSSLVKFENNIPQNSIPRTKSDPTNGNYNKLFKEDFLLSFSLKQNSYDHKNNTNPFINQKLICRTDSKQFDESNNSISSSSSNSSVFSDKFNYDDKNRNLLQNQSKNYFDLGNSIIKKVEFIRLIHSNIELLFLLNKSCEARIFLIETAAAFEAMRAKIPESSIFFTECSDRALHFCPIAIRQPFATNGLVNYKYKEINQIKRHYIKKIDFNKDKDLQTDDSSLECIVNNINNIRKNEKNQMIYWKKRLDFLKKDENFFESKQSTIKKRAKSNVFINVKDFDQNIKSKDFDNKPRESLVGGLHEKTDDDEKPKLKTIPYISRRRSSLNSNHFCVMKTTHF